MNNVGKKRYDEIPIPAGLEQAIWNGMKRAERERRRTVSLKWAASIAAVFCLFFACANITPVYAYASELPVISGIVRVLHIGTGGTRTDGAHITAESQGETVDFRFEIDSEETDAVPVYSAEHLRSPNRLTLTLQGVRGIDDQTVFKKLLATDAVRDVYRSMIGDDSAAGFVIVLNSGYTYEITEHANPAFLSVRFYRDSSYLPSQTIYYLRTKAMPYGEELGMIADMFCWDGATQLKTQSGSYIVTVGQYDTKAEASEALKKIETKFGEDTGLFIASGTADAIPEK